MGKRKGYDSQTDVRMDRRTNGRNEGPFFSLANTGEIGKEVGGGGKVLAGDENGESNAEPDSSATETPMSPECNREAVASDDNAGEWVE